MSTFAFAHGFDAMLLTGAILHSAVIITCIAARNARKSTVWLNLLVSMVIYALSYSLLLFFGNQTGPSPPFQLCLVQTALVYAVPWLVTLCGLALSVQLYVDMAMLSAPERHIRVRTAVLIAVPHIAFFAVGVVVLIYGTHHRIERTPNNTYCHFVGGPFPVYSGAGLALIEVITAVLNGVTAFRLFRYRRVAHGMHNPAARRILKSLLRMSAVVSWSVLGLATSVAVADPDPLNTFNHQLLDGPIGAAPLAIFLIFGLHQDIIDIWCFWRPTPEDTK